MAGLPVPGDQYFSIDGKLHEIKSQLRGKGGYPFDLVGLGLALQNIVEGRFASVSTNSRKVPVWKKIVIGTRSNSKSYRRSLLRAGMWLSEKATAMLQNMAVASERTVLDLVVVSVSGLGISYGCSYRDICARALQLGYELCPAEVAPALRIQYKDQSAGESLHVAMASIQLTEAGGWFFVFELAHVTGVLRMYTHEDREAYKPDDYFIFVRP